MCLLDVLAGYLPFRMLAHHLLPLHLSFTFNTLSSFHRRGEADGSRPAVQAEAKAARGKAKSKTTAKAIARPQAGGEGQGRTNVDADIFSPQSNVSIELIH